MKTALLILDGWGKGPKPERSAIAQADTPFVDSLMSNYPNSELVTFGEEVGLPEGQMGNSEVGHLNLGAGRIVYQELERINVAMRSGELAENEILLDAIDYAKVIGKNLHLVGLVSDGGVHSHIEHLKALCDICKSYGLKKVFIHAFMDGRDTSPTGGVEYMKDLQKHIEGTNAKVATVCGRYYAMDRDKRWERVKLAYDMLTKGEGVKETDPVAAIEKCYAEGITDEFIKPIIITDAKGKALGTFQERDVVLCFNFRTDRCREITTVLTQEDMPEQGMSTVPLYYLTMTRYDESYEGVHVMFDKDDLKDTLGEVISRAGKTQFRIAETEKYPHVTFFFSGGREQPFEGETRKIIPSPKVATYDLQPEMSAPQVTQAALEEIRQNKPDFICLNYANTDMVGHTGVFKAAMKAAETVDDCLKNLVQELLKNDYGIIVLADHGNSDYMINDDGSPNTAHTTNPVPCIFVSKDAKNYTVKNGKLGDIAPTILSLLGLEKPNVMTGENLLSIDNG